jgi:hypothetical protein
MTEKTAQQLFAEALVAFQKDLPHVGKESTADTGKFSYSYAALPDIFEAVLPALTANGLSFTAAPAMTEHGFVLRFSLLHTAGHREDGAYPLPDPGKATPQQIGSAITYGRRYCFCAVTGIAPDEDDDGAAASERSASGHHPYDTNGTQTRHGPGSMPADDPWATAAPAAVTDTEWLESANTRVDLCSTVPELRGIWAEAVQVSKENRITKEDADAFKAKIDARVKELSPESVPA